jgi:hypothetical protein
MNDTARIAKNSSTVYVGGAYIGYNGSHGSLTMNDQTAIDDNIAVNNVGGVTLQYGATMVMNDSASVSGNASSAYNGGIEVNQGSSLVVNSGTISDNHAYLSGGGIGISSTASTHLKAVVMENNRAHSGGAIQVNGSIYTNLTVDADAVFSGNLATSEYYALATSDLATYRAQIAVPDNNWSHGATYGYNNYDISYNAGTAEAPPDVLLTLAVATNQVKVNITPSSNGAETATKTMVSAATNWSNGYSLSMQAGTPDGESSPNNNLKQKLSGATYQIQPVDSSAGATSLTNNTWGYHLGGSEQPSTWTAVPLAVTTLATTTKANAGSVYDTSTAQPTPSTGKLDQYPIWYGARVDTTMPPGDYSGTVVYTVVARP